MYMRHGDVYILGVTKSNANAMMAFQFMSNVRASRFQPFAHPECVRFCCFTFTSDEARYYTGIQSVIVC